MSSLVAACSGPVDTDSMLSDYSTNLLNTTADDRAIKKAKGGSLKNRGIQNRENPGKNDSSGNYNLSSVLSSIQDNAPAYDKTINKRQINKRNTNSSNNSNSNESGVNQIEGNHKGVDMSEDTFQLSSGASSIGELFNSITRTQLLLLFIVSIVVVGLAMYKLDSYVKSSIQQTVQNVNTNYTVIDREHKTKMGDRFLKKPNEIQEAKIQSMAILPIDIIPVPLPTNELTLIAGSVSTLTSDIRSLRKELELVKNKIKADKIKADNINQKKINTENNISIIDVNKLDNTKMSGNVTSSNLSSKNIELKAKEEKIQSKNDEKIAGNIQESKKIKSILTVNLVSLSNESKANKMLERLDIAGLSPSLEKAVVKGKQVYRISVSGFTDLDEAKLFVHNAAAKYGVKGSRIRNN